GFGIVVAGDLLFEEADEKGLEVEVLVEHSEFLEHDFGALKAAGILAILHFVIEILDDGVAVGEAALDAMFDGELGVVGGELENGVHGGEELFGLFGGDVSFGLGLLCAWRRLL